MSGLTTPQGALLDHVASGVENWIAERPFYGFCVIPEWGVLRLMGCFSLKFEDFLTMTKEICITKPNLGNNCLIVFTLHLEKWILHRLLQLYAYRDLLKNLFANSVVFFCIFQWTTSKFYSQPTSYVFLVNVKSVFQPVFANHSIDRVLCILSSRRRRQLPHCVQYTTAQPPKTVPGGGGEVCVQWPWKNSPVFNGKICEMWTVHMALILTFWCVTPLQREYRNATSKDSKIKHFFYMGRSGIFVIKI